MQVSKQSQSVLYQTLRNCTSFSTMNIKGSELNMEIKTDTLINAKQHNKKLEGVWMDTHKLLLQTVSQRSSGENIDTHIVFCDTESFLTNRVFKRCDVKISQYIARHTH